jgi:hypothetical protein
MRETRSKTALYRANVRCNGRGVRQAVLGMDINEMNPHKTMEVNVGSACGARSGSELLGRITDA